jgi:hypothetical protein
VSNCQITRPALFGLSLTAMFGAAGAQADDLGHPTFSIDVVADCNRFITEGTPHPANPAFGDYFMQEGLIYRPGTLAANCPNGDGCGLNPDGTAEFPEEVIGKWTCYGSFVGNGAATEAGVWLYSTQVYEFDAAEIAEHVFEPGAHALVSHGPERIDLDVPFDRAVTGGYGRFAHVRGDVTQTKIGFNQTECENFTFEFDVRPRSDSLE